jgi:hypothetical protein
METILVHRFGRAYAGGYAVCAGQCLVVSLAAEVVVEWVSCQRPKK